MAKFEVSLPFDVREAHTVAWAVVHHVWALTYGQPARPAAWLPMRIRARAAAEGGARFWFHFPGRVAVEVWMTSYDSSFGTHWEVNKVRARAPRPVGAPWSPEEKVTYLWEGEGLEEIAPLWGGSPHPAPAEG